MHLMNDQNYYNIKDRLSDQLELILIEYELYTAVGIT